MPVENISQTLKELRLRQKLSLKDVARRAGTSIAAIHRYENRWHRFEVQTLAKLADALGAEFSVDFKIKKNRAAAGSSDEAFKTLKPLFWDVKIAKKDLLKHQDWLIKRVLEFGNREQVHLIIRLFSLDAILATFAKSQHQFTRKTQAAWSAFFKTRDPACTLKSYQKAPRNFLGR